MTSFKRFRTSKLPRRRLLSSTGLAMGMLALVAAAPTGAARAAGTEPWITTWAATPAPRWAEELPAPFNVPETLEGQTVRQIARISVGGDQVRIVLSNEFGTRPVTIGNTTVALSAGGDKVDPETIKPVTFGGQTSAVIPPGAPLISDPVDLAVKPLSSVAVSFYLPKKTGVTSVHWDGAQTTYISAAGDKTKDADFKPDSTDKSRLFLSRILTTAKPDSNAIVFFGNSITDGACSTVDTNNRWPDHIAERLQAEGHPDVAVVNEAYSGDRVLTNGMGTNALSRFDISVLDHPRVSTVVMMMGINDIGWPGKDCRRRAILSRRRRISSRDISRSSSARTIMGSASWASRSRLSSTRSRACRPTAITRPRRSRSAKRSTTGFAPTRRLMDSSTSTSCWKTRTIRSTSTRPIIAATTCIRTTPVIRRWPSPWT